MQPTVFTSTVFRLGVLIVVLINLKSIDGQTQLQRRRIQQKQQLATEDEESVPLSITQRERRLVEAEKSLKVREDQVELNRRAYAESEAVVAERELALDVRDTDLDQRSRDLDRRVLETDRRLKERERRLAQREAELAARENDILKRAEAREQDIERLSRERETSAAIREKALVARETLVAEKERALMLESPEEATNISRNKGQAQSSTNRRQQQQLRPNSSSRNVYSQFRASPPAPVAKTQYLETEEVEEQVIEPTSEATRVLRNRSRIRQRQ